MVLASTDYTISDESQMVPQYGTTVSVGIMVLMASQNLVNALQYVIVVENTTTNRVVKYGPYLTPKEGKGIDWENYAPTWSGHHDGYLLQFIKFAKG